MSAIENGTRIHTTYAKAYAREQRNSRIAFFTWMVMLFSLSFLDTPGFRTAGFVIVILLFLMILTHYQRDAVRHRALVRSQIEKPL